MSGARVTLQEEIPPLKELLSLYKAVGWTIYSSEPDKLQQAFDNSTYVVTARQDQELLGLARCMSDDVSIFYLQDLLVAPDHQGKGLGRMLLENALQRFSHVRQKVLLTDNEERQKRLYTSCGYKSIGDLKKYKMNAYLQLTYCDLE